MNLLFLTATSTSPVAPLPQFSTLGAGAPNMLQAPLPHEAPLHDIVGPLSFFAYTPLQIFLALLCILFVLSLVFWSIKRWRQKPVLTPREACLERLRAIRENLMQGNDHDFGMLVSSLLRGYLGAVFGLAAPRQTTEEFLASLRGHNRFTQKEQKSLEAFLVHSDLLKFAHGAASQEDRLSLVLAAEQLIDSSQNSTADASESITPGLVSSSASLCTAGLISGDQTGESEAPKEVVAA
jgi:hypothetical protein